MTNERIEAVCGPAARPGKGKVQDTSRRDRRHPWMLSVVVVALLGAAVFGAPRSASAAEHFHCRMTFWEMDDVHLVRGIKADEGRFVNTGAVEVHATADPLGLPTIAIGVDAASGEGAAEEPSTAPGADQIENFSTGRVSATIEGRHVGAVVTAIGVGGLEDAAWLVNEGTIMTRASATAEATDAGWRTLADGDGGPRLCGRVWVTSIGIDARRGTDRVLHTGAVTARAQTVLHTPILDGRFSNEPFADGDHARRLDSRMIRAAARSDSAGIAWDDSGRDAWTNRGDIVSEALASVYGGGAWLRAAPEDPDRRWIRGRSPFLGASVAAFSTSVGVAAGGTVRDVVLLQGTVEAMSTSHVEQSPVVVEMSQFGLRLPRRGGLAVVATADGTARAIGVDFITKPVPDAEQASTPGDGGEAPPASENGDGEGPGDGLGDLPVVVDAVAGGEFRITGTVKASAEVTVKTTGRDTFVEDVSVGVARRPRGRWIGQAFEIVNSSSGARSLAVGGRFASDDVFELGATGGVFVRSAAEATAGATTSLLRLSGTNRLTGNVVMMHSSMDADATAIGLQGGSRGTLLRGGRLEVQAVAWTVPAMSGKLLTGNSACTSDDPLILARGL